MIKNNYLYYYDIYANFSLDREVYKEQILSLWQVSIHYRLITKNLRDLRFLVIKRYLRFLVIKR
jgi:hypothetical protein